MGDMADAIINGDFDEVTGEYLGNGQGFPRTLAKNNKPNAEYGVRKYLIQKGFAESEHDWLIISYGGEKFKIADLKVICKKIQSNFGQFINYISKIKSQQNNEHFK
jgi:hypothetical protein